MKHLLSFNKKFTLTISIVFLLLFLPTLSLHASGLVPECGKVVDGVMNAPCGFGDFIDLINKVIHFLLFVIATPLTALILCYAGFLLITSSGNPETITRAKRIIKNVVIGYIIALAAWLIVHTIFSSLGFKGDTFLEDNDIAQTEITPPSSVTPITKEEPTQEDTSGVLYIGGSYDEESPNGNTCPINLPSKPLVGLKDTPSTISYLQVPKAYADETDEEKEQAKKRAVEFRTARCWLVDWYSLRKIPNPNIQKEFENDKTTILMELKTTPFEILDAKTYEKRYGRDSGGKSEPNFTFYHLFLITKGKIVIKYGGNGGNVLYTALHELTHHAEKNGGLIPNSQTAYFDKNIFPENYIEKYFADFLTKNPEVWFSKSINKDNNQLINLVPKWFNLEEGIQYFYCYTILSRGLNNKPCYVVHKEKSTLQTNLNYSKTSYNLETTLDPLITEHLVYESTEKYTEIDARLALLRFLLGVQPDKPTSSSDSLLFYIQSNDLLSESKLFHDYRIESKVQLPQREGSDPDRNSQISDVVTDILIPILGKYECRYRSLLGPEINCKETLLPPDNRVPMTYYFKDSTSARNWMIDMVKNKLVDLLNNSM